ncbi:hypothetical protein [uncultured Stenotrophomonas sp.]|uniref:tetratricopeptide repeat protein n=1 Tax=uncultured Stenotrophomonas sp. TaxID=165438 RepID=UPI0028ECAA1C|nr:hypothetical protein [uncultured Stenotrophomonas sp.]
MDDNAETIDSAAFDDLRDRAYAHFDNGELREASALFGELSELRPEAAHLHYMRGLAHKYLRDWPASLAHNLRAQQLEETFDEASAWNAGIAATALGDWAEARRQWARCGMTVPDGEGPIETNFGTVSVRLNPWGNGETVFARRIDIVRAQLLNVPLPESGHRLFDIVLHDGAVTGERALNGKTVPVFNVLQTLQRSDHQTFVAFVRCPTFEDATALENAQLPGIGFVEDWTHSIRHLCLRCSYGVPHEAGEHRDGEARNDDWTMDRHLGIGAQGKAAVQRLLADWAAAGPGRRVDAIEHRQVVVSGPVEGTVWWRGHDGDDGNEEESDA